MEISFKSWLYNEIARSMDNLPLDKIQLDPVEKKDFGPFDSVAAQAKCTQELDFDDSDYYSSVYEEPSEDPNFDNDDNPDKWADDNPRPNMEDYEDKDLWQKEADDWDGEYEEVEAEYKRTIDRWHKEMDRRRQRGAEDAHEARQREIYKCVQKKASEWETAQEDQIDGYSGKFSFGDQNFEVSMSREEPKYRNLPVPGVFEITFSGPDGFATTKKAGSSATIIYNHVLASVKKMVDKETAEKKEVNGFVFFPYEPGMALIYQKFYNDYLKPNGYIRVEPTLYLKTSYLRQALSQETAPGKRAAVSGIMNTKSYVANALQQVKSEKIEARKKMMLAKSYVGKIMKWHGSYGPSVLAYVYGANDKGAVSLAYVDQWNFVKMADSGVSFLSDAHDADPAQITRLLERLRSRTDLFSKIYTDNLLDLYKKHLPAAVT